MSIDPNNQPLVASSGCCLVLNFLLWPETDSWDYHVTVNLTRFQLLYKSPEDRIQMTLVFSLVPSEIVILNSILIKILE